MGDKVLHLMRHGTTEMNEYLSKPSPTNRYGHPRFVDPLLFDTRLTARGKAGAQAAAARVRRLHPRPELLVVSPLTRALQTATLAFGSQPGCPVLIEPLWRERLYLSSDVGRPPAALATEFPHYAMDHLSDDVWWHSMAPHDPLAIHPEPQHVFDARMEQLWDWLSSRPESVIACVTHWGCLQALTGIEFGNCEVRTTSLSAVELRRRATSLS